MVFCQALPKSTLPESHFFLLPGLPCVNRCDLALVCLPPSSLSLSSQPVFACTSPTVHELKTEYFMLVLRCFCLSQPPLRSLARSRTLNSLRVLLLLSLTLESLSVSLARSRTLISLARSLSLSYLALALALAHPRTLSQGRDSSCKSNLHPTQTLPRVSCMSVHLL